MRIQEPDAHCCDWVQGLDLELRHRHGYLIAAWVVEKNVFTLILVPYAYHTRVPFQVWTLSKKLLRYYPQTWVLWRTKQSQFKVGVFLAGSSYSRTTLLRWGGEEKLHFPFWNWQHAKKALWGTVTLLFVANWRIKRTTKYYSLFQEC